MAGDIGKLLRSPVFWLKVLELLLIFIMIALMVNGGYVGNISKVFVVFGTVYAYTMLNALMILAFVLDEAFSKKLTMLVTGVGGVLFVTAGALLIEAYDIYPIVSDLSLGAGILGIIIGAIYLADTGYTFKFD